MICVSQMSQLVVVNRVSVIWFIQLIGAQTRVVFTALTARGRGNECQDLVITAQWSVVACNDLVHTAQGTDPAHTVVHARE